MAEQAMSWHCRHLDTLAEDCVRDEAWQDSRRPEAAYLREVARFLQTAASCIDPIEPEPLPDPEDLLEDFQRRLRSHV